jgi:hypothetical protein
VPRVQTRWSCRRMGTACRSQPSSHRGPCQAFGAFHDLPKKASTTLPRRARRRRLPPELRRRCAHPGWQQPGRERWVRLPRQPDVLPLTRSVRRTGGWVETKMAQRTSSLQGSRSVPSDG